MDPLERATLLQQEAGQVLEHLGLVDLLHTCSAKVQFTGSYFMGLMAWPDIDMEASLASIDQVFAVAAQLAKVPRVNQVVFEPSSIPRLAGGLYLRPRIAWGDWGNPWKIDLWFLDEGMLEANHADMCQLQQALTPELRCLILEYKNSVLTPEQRTPTYSGYWIYQAVLREGLRDFSQVTRYLVEHGIKVAA
jgi:hypothetical protein